MNKPENNPSENGTEVDAKYLTDRDAEIYEAVQKLFEVCGKYDIVVFVRAILNHNKNNGQFIGAQTVSIDEEKNNLDYQFLLELMSKWIHESTKGKLKVVEIEEI